MPAPTANSAFRPRPEVSARLLWGKSIVIVGDTAGVGRATAALLVEKGAKVFIAVRSPAELSAAFAEIAKTGGEWDGLVVDFHSPKAIRRFFDQAEQRLGKIDGLVNALASDLLPVTGTAGMPDENQTPQSQCVQEALQRMHNRRGSSVINIRVDGQASLPVHLRRTAREHGIRMTAIEPGTAAVYGPGNTREAARPEDVARCVYESLIQPFGVDVIFLRGKVQSSRTA
jgi:NAD(P)-dependent dehydrogenase (short-subunit alcohol dehydrogenase family)